MLNSWLRAAAKRPRLRHVLGDQHPALHFPPLALDPFALDPYPGHIGHGGQEAQIVAGELSPLVQRVEIHQTDDTIFGLKRNRDQGMHALIHDRLAAL